MEDLLQLFSGKDCRDEIKFDNVDQLAEQMKLDKQQVMLLFK